MKQTLQYWWIEAQIENFVITSRQKKKAFHEEERKAFGERRVGRDREFYVLFAVLSIF